MKLGKKHQVLLPLTFYAIEDGAGEDPVDAVLVTWADSLPLGTFYPDDVSAADALKKILADGIAFSATGLVDAVGEALYGAEDEEDEEDEDDEDDEEDEE